MEGINKNQKFAHIPLWRTTAINFSFFLGDFKLLHKNPKKISIIICI